MDLKTRHPGTKLLAAIGVVAVLGNALGATLVFIYFLLIESGLTFGAPPRNVSANVTFFVVGMVIILGSLAWLAQRINGPLRRGLNKKLPFGDTQELAVLAGQLLNAPLQIAGLSVLGWLIAGVFFNVLPPFIQLARPPDPVRVLSGMYLVGAPVTAVFIYFVLEWFLRGQVRRVFPPAALVAIPSSVRINVLPKMLSVCLMIGTMPVAIVSFITLWQIYQIDLERQSVSVFLSQMPVVIVFLLVLAIVVGVGLSMAMARSVSEPLREARSAMRRIGRGDLDVAIPVVSNDEIGVMAEGFNYMVEGLKERDFVRDTFGRYVSEDVAAEVLKARKEANLDGEQREITVLVADLRGFTAISASLQPRQVLTLINRFLGRMTEIILRHGGTIDEFTGDGILVFFGAPRRLPDHPRRGVACALEMQQAMGELNEQNLRVALPELKMGIGINCGELVVGNIGSEMRAKYGAVGSAINVAFRVESETAGGEILVTEAVMQRLEKELHVTSQKEARLKGIQEPMVLSRVTGLL